VHPVSPLNPGSLREPPELKYTIRSRLIRHAPYFILQLAESPLTQRLFGKILGRIVLGRVDEPASSVDAVTGAAIGP